MKSSLIIALACVTLASCTNEPDHSSTATVYFVLDAPLCSSQLAMQFQVDGATIGTDTFRVHLTPDHTTSHAFAVDTGTRTIGARVVGGYVWPDSVVHLDAAAVFRDTLPFYCS